MAETEVIPEDRPSWCSPELWESFKEQERIRAIEANLEKNGPLLRQLLGLPDRVDSIRISVDGFGTRKDGSKNGWIYSATYRADVK